MLIGYCPSFHLLESNSQRLMKPPPLEIQSHGLWGSLGLDSQPRHLPEVFPSSLRAGLLRKRLFVLRGHSYARTPPPWRGYHRCMGYVRVDNATPQLCRETRRDPVPRIIRCFEVIRIPAKERNPTDDDPYQKASIDTSAETVQPGILCDSQQFPKRAWHGR